MEETAVETLDIGLFWSDATQEYRMAKVKEADRATHLYVVGASGTGKS